MIINDYEKAVVKRYGTLFTNTGGNDVLELLERNDVNFQNNYVVAALQVGCLAQLQLLCVLIKDGLLPELKAGRKKAKAA